MSGVTLREASTNDLEDILAWVNDPAVTGRFARLGHVTREEEVAYLSRITQSEKDRLYVVRDETGQTIGTAGLHEIDMTERSARFGIIIGRKDRWGRGYGSATVDALIDKAYELGIERVWGVVRADNARMRRVMEKNGFREDVYLPERYCQQDACYDMIHATREITGVQA